jgi:hypothetical protein
MDDWVAGHHGQANCGGKVVARHSVGSGLGKHLWGANWAVHPIVSLLDKHFYSANLVKTAH